MGHRAFVQVCLAVTGLGSVYIGWELYNYFTKVKPIKKEMEERFKEDLLKEGRMIRDIVQTESN